MAVALSPAIASIPVPSRQGSTRPAPRPTVLENLATTNKAMVGRIGRDLSDIAHHPVTSLEHMVAAMAFPFLHPVMATRYLVNSVQDDPLGGAIDATGSAAGLATIGLVVVAGLSALAAPVTGGASLAVAAGALAVAETLGTVTIGLDAAGFAVHEARGAAAKTEQDARDEGETAASYVEDQMLNAVATVAGNALEGHLKAKVSGAASAEGTIARLSNNAIGLMGVYDSPAYINRMARMSKVGAKAHPSHVIGGTALNTSNQPSGSRDRLELSSTVKTR